MGIFDKLRKTHAHADTGEVDLKDNERRYESYAHTDILPSLQSNIVKKVNYNDLTTRWLHTKANPYGHQHTFGVINEMFWHQPYPFMYISDDSEDVQKAPAIKELDAIHKLWQKARMFFYFKNCLSQGAGIGTAWIVQIMPGKFRVFNPTDIETDTQFWTNEKTGEIEEVWFKMKAFGQKRGKFTSDASKHEDRVIKARIGINAVQYQPFPDNDNIFGLSELLPIWTTMTYRARNHYSATIYNAKGGVNSRILVAPDNVGSNSKRIFKKEALKGVESELIEIYYPSSMVNQQIDPSKIVQWKENAGNSPQFDKVDTLLSADSPLPPSFTQGSPSGALGGKAPQEDAKRINRFFQSYVSKCQDLVKDINRVFFGLERDDYMIVPYFREEDVMEQALDDNDSLNGDNDSDDQNDTKKEKKEKKESNSQITRTHTIEFSREELRNHSTGKKEVIYKGNMLSSGFYEYEEMDYWTGKVNTVYEYLSESELLSFINEPTSVKEFYLDLEHMQFVNVERNNSLGKVTLTGSTKINGNRIDTSIIQFKEGYDPKHPKIYLSPIYSCSVIDEGKKYKGKKALSQKDISIINCSITSFPRSHLTDLDTGAERVSE